MRQPRARRRYFYIPRIKIRGDASTASSTVCDAPVERWMPKPIDTRRSDHVLDLPFFAPSLHCTTTISTPLSSQPNF